MFLLLLLVKGVSWRACDVCCCVEARDWKERSRCYECICIKGKRQGSPAYLLLRLHLVVTCRCCLLALRLMCRHGKGTWEIELQLRWTMFATQ